MINLLPPSTKENFFYGRRNTLLLKWLIGVVIGVAGLLLIQLGGVLFMNQAATTYIQNNAGQKAQLEKQNLTQVQKEVENISSHLKLVVKVLSQEVMTSQLLQQIATVLPRGSVLTGLNFSQTSTGMNLQAAASDYQTASQIQINLQDPNNKIFSKADLVSIQCQENSGGDAAFSKAYPCRVEIRAKFADNNPYLLINNKAATP